MTEGVHDMGGSRGYGAVMPEADEPVFHAQWERRAFALTIAMAMPGGWNIDMSRAARENRPAGDYLSKSYYELWLAGLEKLMAERGLVTPDEIDAGRPLYAPSPIKAKLTPEHVEQVLYRGAPTEREAQAPARFSVGDRVRTRNTGSPTHTRLPRYARGRVGVVELLHGCHVFPDTNALAAGEHPQWLYTVCFEGIELWGAGADPALKVSIDAWESYLEPA